MVFIASHLYFFAGLYFFVFWVILFCFIDNIRKDMFAVSIVGAILGFFVQKMHLIDWWRPHFIFNSIVKVEDILFGFSVAGVAFSISFIILSHYYSLDGKYNAKNKTEKLIIFVLSLLLLFCSFYYSHFSSFQSSILALSIAPSFVLFKKPKVIGVIFCVGIFMLIIASPGYLFGILINPNWVQDEWLLSSLSGITFLKIPVEEFIWFFFLGIGVAAYTKIFNKEATDVAR